MKKRSESAPTFEDLIGLGNHSARKNYYPELSRKLDELEAERNRYKWLFDHALHGIFQADLNGQIRAANPAMASICGYRNEAHLQTVITDIGEHLFGDPLCYRQLLQQLYQDGKVFRYETQLRQANGTLIYVSMNVLLKRESDDITLEAFVQDITERVMDQVRLRQLNEELEGRVEERTFALATVNSKLWDEIRQRESAQQEMRLAKEQAEEANRSKDKYLAAASHDLLQPMNAARLLVSTLRERPMAADDHHLVERIHVALEGAEELLTDLLDISKLDQNAVQPDRTAFHLSQLLSALQTEFQPVAERAGLSFRVRCHDRLVHSDARLLMRILRNFVSNAFRYTNQGGVLVGCRVKGESLEIQVWDTGEGIPDTQTDSIFEAFNQLQQHRNGQRAGVGLGLAIVERIARVLEHPVSVRSKPDKGSMFSIAVPLAEGAEQPLPRVTKMAAASHFQDEVVLIVDNDPDILLSMKVLLMQWGLTPLTAKDTAAALNLCETLTPDIVLLDYHLDKGLTGIDVLEALRDRFEAIPAALLTAERADESLKRFRSMGLQVLNKPVKPGKLRALISHMLSNEQLRKELGHK
ncbi:NahK/ErcS family hybrid sensor histidine kinase/response regulator [Neptunomonas concharum]|uniref:histidine kinase n=1 Tax=Neptunomonas concharum TaxID=1031538 RepID=A0A5P1R6H9_9GAMM|nr:NahK/ErcS family hybrid sensor histidine kinase/response regulator [Neptunomonas concharum]QEQ95278.1 response regulator [Neptunomonas concharum]